MYSTCLFCHANLGSNQVLEAFPIGGRLAYDPEKGRLWALCKRCGRWNLSPLEERWEALEDCEGLFRATKLRASTDNIGLARLADGTDLVRIGRPQLPEFAAWRYGKQFAPRYRRTLLVESLAHVGLIGAVVAAPNALVITIPAVALYLGGAITYAYRKEWRVVARVDTPSGATSIIRGHHLKSARVTPDNEGADDARWILSTRADGEDVKLRGEHATWLVGKILARINHVGGGETVLNDAVARLEHEGGSNALFHHIAEKPPYEKSAWARWWYETGGAAGAISQPGTLQSMPAADRLALEMASHEEAERRAMEGELKALEAAWREAEEIAEISDSLLLPPGTEEFLERHRRSSDRTIERSND